MTPVPSRALADPDQAAFELWAMSPAGQRRADDLRRAQQASTGAGGPRPTYQDPAVERDWQVWRARGAAGRGAPVAATDGAELWWLSGQPTAMPPTALALYLAGDALPAGAASVLRRHADWLDALGQPGQAARMRQLADEGRDAAAGAPPLPPAPAHGADGRESAAPAFLADGDLQALRRFDECCADPDAGGHDVPKASMRRLAEIGVVRAAGPSRHVITSFGEYVLQKHAAMGLSLPLGTYEDYCRILSARPGAGMSCTIAQAGEQPAPDPATAGAPGPTP